MKTMKKVLALLVAVLMIAASMSAFAAAGDFTSTPESEIIATGLATNDTVDYYQLVEWDSTNSNWKLTALGTATGISLDNLINGIDATEAATIANTVANAVPAYTAGHMTETETAGTFHATGVAAGMYYLLATPADVNTIYNPAFVSADYYVDGNTVEFSDHLAPAAYIKKSGIPFDKDVVGENKYIDTKPGDVIPYKITTTIPAYGANFQNPVFTITDTLSNNLTLGDTITVKYGSTTVTATDSNVTITRTDNQHFTVAFKDTYLKSLMTGGVAVEITYNATVGADNTNVVFMDNKAKLTYSHTPTENQDKEDITRHHYFAIDGNLLGGNNTKTHEVIKTGVKPDGVTPIYTETTTYHETAVAPLAQATYVLKGEDLPAAGRSVQTDEGGHITFTGLKAGTYTLQETDAPAGFVKDSTVYTVVIDPTYNGDILESYTITFSKPGATAGTLEQVGSASFTMTNNGTPVETTESTPENASTFLKNTRGNELPSTGGMGTTLFYIGGSILVILAAILLITKRRMGSDE